MYKVDLSLKDSPLLDCCLWCCIKPALRSWLAKFKASGLVMRKVEASQSTPSFPWKECLKVRSAFFLVATISLRRIRVAMVINALRFFNFTVAMVHCRMSSVAIPSFCNRYLGTTKHSRMRDHTIFFKILLSVIFFKWSTHFWLSSATTSSKNDMNRERNCTSSKSCSWFSTHFFSTLITLYPRLTFCIIWKFKGVIYRNLLNGNARLYSSLSASDKEGDGGAPI